MLQVRGWEKKAIGQHTREGSIATVWGREVRTGLSSGNDKGEHVCDGSDRTW